MSDVIEPIEEREEEQEEEHAAAADQPESDAPIEEIAEDCDAEEEEAPPDLPEGINLMQAFIEAQNEAQSNKDSWLRARAEFANYKKRIERERSEIFQRGSHDTLKALLPIVDDFDRAFESVPEEIHEHAWIGGVSMIQRKFATLLEHFDVEAIDPTGQPFDPRLHEAIGTEDSDEMDSDHVTETLQKGYRAGDSILRQALVKVAS